MNRMQQKLALAISVLLVGSVATLQQTAAQATANAPTVFIFNTAIPTNAGLEFCTPEMIKGCFESVLADGQALTPVATQNEATYFLAGGLYSPKCRFVETTATPCEIPYVVVRALGQ
jgi:hypothetical protein